ncbi:N-acetylmuramic acid 6-phosphate etherase [Pseudonocardia spinosispora]|uniref:N-acetylmuramic acid 6-phosphate etherase n=1 Tax=Pseudonocardia spinosispora TaxID=103441 RepID=UPI000415DCD6|nr:N-acetylmuramic acid 6-phosphate etherase [Pseudonocardia spinosispora]
MTTDITVDVGRSTTRVRVDGGPAHRRPGGAGLGDPDGPHRIAALVRDAIAAVRDAVADTSWRLAVAVPGAFALPDAAEELADRLVRSPRPEPGTVLVAGDVAAWHAGALSGRDGVVLAVGTGAVALGVRDGTLRQADGQGPLIGDEGSGAWLGLEGLRAAARARDGRGPATALVSLGRAIVAMPSAAELAEVAPAVLAAAADGDVVACTIVDSGVDALANTARTAGATDQVAVVGGLADVLLPRLRGRHPDLTWLEPDGDATDGLRLLLDRSGTALEKGLVRVSGAGASPVEDAAVDAEVDLLPTEAVRPGSDQIDVLPTPALVARLVDGQAGAAPSVARARDALAAAVDHAASALGRGGRLVYVGAGTPGRLAVQDAAELTPTFGLDPARVPTLLAGGASAASTAVENAEDDTGAARTAIRTTDVGPDDVVVGVSASGRTPFVREALRAARERGAVTVAIVSAPNSPMARDATVVVELLTGPEVLAGSTRLAAGTAQKIALNTLSTAAMVRTGATYRGWMVSMRATNAKLRRRAVRIVRDAAGVDEPTAARLLDDSAGDVRVALVSGLTGLDARAAAERLADTGSVRAAVSR